MAEILTTAPWLVWEQRRRRMGDYDAALDVAYQFHAITGHLKFPRPPEDG